MSEIELSRDEDSVSSLANLAIKNGLITFAGINSAPADIASEKNEHLRSFEIIYPAKRRSSREHAVEESEKAKAAQGTIGMIGKAALFSQSGPKSEVYQRIIRLSPVQRGDTPSKRIGAVATGLGDNKNEIVVFDATFSEPAASHVIQRIMPAEGVEAADLAITELQKELFSLVYCTDYDIYAININYDFQSEKSRGSLSEPRAVYTIPQPHSASKPVRPTFRALRFLSPEYLLLLQNLPGRTGAELLILRLFPSTTGEIVARKPLPRRIKAATGLDVCVLDGDPKTGARQIVVAVVGQDVTVEVMTIDYLGSKENTLGKFYSFITLRDVHPHQMTGVTFSPFQAPRGSRSSSTGNGSDGSSRNGKPPSRPSTPVERGPQFLRLATVSMGNTVVVDHFQLTEVPTSSSDSVRYALSTARARFLYSGSIVFLASAIALVSAVLLQAVLGASSRGSGGSLSVQDSVRSLLYGPRAPLPTFSSSSSSSSPLPSSFAQPRDSSPLEANIPLRTILSQHLANTETPNHQQQAIVLRPRTGSGSSTKPNSNTEDQIAAEIHTNLESFLRENTAHAQARLARAEAKAEAKAKAKAAQKATKSPSDDNDDDDDNDKNDDNNNKEDGYISDTEDNDDDNNNNALLKPWNDLSEHDRSWWTDRLREAGAWAVEEGGEAALNLQGVFFSEIGPRSAAAMAAAAAANVAHAGASAANAAMAAGANVAAVVEAAAGDGDSV